MDDITKQLAGYNRESLEQIAKAAQDQLDKIPERSSAFSHEVLEKKLPDAFACLTKGYEFKPGQLVRWKNGMRIKKFPSTDEPAIVIEVLDEPVYASNMENSAYFREPLDLILGVFDPDGDFIIFHYDKRRFEPYK